MRLARVLGIAAVAGGTGVLGGCVLADPPPSLPIVVEGPPTVNLASVVPPGPVITSWPTRFYVPVTLTDPTTSVYWEMYADETANLAPNATGHFLRAARGSLGPDAGNAVTLVVVAQAPSLAPGCHIIKLVLMIEVNGTLDTNPADEAFVSWIYDSSGDPSSCASLDAGSFNDGSLPPPDAGAG